MNEQSCWDCKHDDKSENEFPCIVCQHNYINQWEKCSSDAAADYHVIGHETHDPVNHPCHYTQGAIETIDIIRVITDTMDGFRAYCVGNALKYIARHEYKNGVEDLKKAVWYLNRLIEEDEDDD